MAYTTSAARPRGFGCFNAAVTAVITLACALMTRPAQGATIRDEGGFFSPDAEARVGQMIDAIEREYGKRLVVETYPGIPPAMRGDYSPQRKDEFFTQWVETRGKQSGADFVILVSREPAHIKVRANRAARDSGLFPGEEAQRVSDAMAAAFRDRDYDAGLSRAVQQVRERLAGNLGPEGSASRGGGGTTAPPARAPAPSGGNAPGEAPSGSPAPTGMQCGKIQGWVCLIVGGLIIFGLLRAFMRRRAAGSGGDPRYGRQVGYGGDPGVGQSGYGMGGGAGFGRGILGGLLGGMLGGAAYDHLRGRGSQADASTTEG